MCIKGFDIWQICVISQNDTDEFYEMIAKFKISDYLIKVLCLKNHHNYSPKVNIQSQFVATKSLAGFLILNRKGVMERRDFFIDDIEKIGIIVAHILGFKGLKRTSEQQQEINNGLSELFGLDFDKMAFEELVSKIKAIENPQKLDYLVQLLQLEMENEYLTEEQLSLRNQVLKIAESEMGIKYNAKKTTTFFRHINSPK